ncbi:hypothetical protein DRO02_06270, partial [archaeon]
RLRGLRQNGLPRRRMDLRLLRPPVLHAGTQIPTPGTWTLHMPELRRSMPDMQPHNGQGTRRNVPRMRPPSLPRLHDRQRIPIQEKDMQKMRRPNLTLQGETNNIQEGL